MASEFHNQLTSMLPQLRTYALTLTHCRFRADDLLQETAFLALRAQSQFTPGTNFKAWVYRIMRNGQFTSYRRAKRTPVAMDAFAESLLAHDGDQENKVLVMEVLKAMGALHWAQREVLTLFCISGMNYEEIASALGCSVGTVKSRLWRARSRIRALILGDEAEETGEALENATEHMVIGNVRGAEAAA